MNDALVSHADDLMLVSHAVNALVSFAEHVTLVSHAVRGAPVSHVELVNVVSHAVASMCSQSEPQYQAGERADLTHCEAGQLKPQGGTHVTGSLTHSSCQAEAVLLLRDPREVLKKRYCQELPQQPTRLVHQARLPRQEAQPVPLPPQHEWQQQGKLHHLHLVQHAVAPELHLPELAPAAVTVCALLLLHMLSQPRLPDQAAQNMPACPPLLLCRHQASSHLQS